jgi:hypothetical protein
MRLAPEGLVKGYGSDRSSPLARCCAAGLVKLTSANNTVLAPSSHAECIAEGAEAAGILCQLSADHPTE